MTAMYATPPLDMVQQVKNIIDNYRMGEMRALAQDPIQNAMDARRLNANGPVEVRYQVVKRQTSEGKSIHLLSITDRNTTGLRGPALSEAELEARGLGTGQFFLNPDENWAAWESMNYTKVSEEALGSRGQGKAAYMYHSRHPHPAGRLTPGGLPVERMCIVYDTLLEDGTYRTGLRLALPNDKVLQTPFEDEEAREIVRTSWSDEDLMIEVPLYLDPLGDIGTRVTIPFLTAEALDAITGNELYDWIQKCWWRPIQLGKLRVWIEVEGGDFREVEVPDWWADSPWQKNPKPSNVYVKENLKVDPQSDDLLIKRIVLFQDDDLTDNDLDRFEAQFAGVQLIRGGQWVVTLGAKSKFGDQIPKEQRAGFRGFVEFEKRLDKELREYESSSHDYFQKRRKLIRQIEETVAGAVTEFAVEQGWTGAEDDAQTEDMRATEVLEKISDVFLRTPDETEGPNPNKTKWTLDIDGTFPSSRSRRIDWGKSLKNLTVAVTQHPSNHPTLFKIELALVNPAGTESKVASKSSSTTKGSGKVKFGDFEIHQRNGRKGVLACPNPGAYGIRAKCVVNKETVASKTFIVYVGQDAAATVFNDHGLAVEIENLTAERPQVLDGDRVRVTVTASNRTASRSNFGLNVSIPEWPVMLADVIPVDLDAAASPNLPERLSKSWELQVFVDQPTNPGPDPFVVLSPGHHRVITDLLPMSANGVSGPPVAHASRGFQVGPDSGGSRLPFRVMPYPDETSPKPKWELAPVPGGADEYVLRYAKQHPAHRAALQQTTGSSNRTSLTGINLFLAEICCEGLLEWAWRRFHEGDDGAFDLLTKASNGSAHAWWDFYEVSIDQLVTSSGDDTKEVIEIQRRVVSAMLYLLERG